MRHLASLPAAAALATMLFAAPPPGARAQPSVSAPPFAADFVYHGRPYCFVPDGWEGPGWYWCGFAHHAGFGFGGPPGWRGWRVPGGWHHGPHGMRPRFSAWHRPHHGRRHGHHV